MWSFKKLFQKPSNGHQRATLEHECHRQQINLYINIKAFMSCLTEDYILTNTPSFPISPQLIHRLSPLLFERQGGDWRKKASLNPIRNHQRALKYMNGGGPAAALALPYSEFYFPCAPAAAAEGAAVTEAAERRWCTAKSRKRHSATTV